MVLQIYKTGDLKYITPFGYCEGANIVVKDTLNGRMAYTYASEADILNMALFGRTAAQWRREKAYRQLELLKKNQDTIETLKKIFIEDTGTNS